jgi:hypothetical protein
MASILCGLFAVGDILCWMGVENSFRELVVKLLKRKWFS